MIQFQNKTNRKIYHRDKRSSKDKAKKRSDKRIAQQSHTVGVKVKKEWTGNAMFEDGSGDTFTDKQFHSYLRRNGVKQPQDEGNEYFDKDDNVRSTCCLVCL